MATSPESDETDKNITASIANILQAQSQIPAGSIKFEVRKGVVTLSGEVDYEFQRHDVEKPIEEVQGVKFIDNEITIRKQ
jgi:osmotically-inducible protein OsmY